MGNNYVDLFATKGLEYILVIAFLITLVVFWRFLNRSTRTLSPLRGASERNSAPAGWFLLRDGMYYHQGHTWAMPEPGDVVKVGIDDFARKLVGKTQSVKLPSIGTRVGQGEPGWEFLVHSESIPMLAPVNGEVVGVNEEVIKSPELIHQDPYEKGWLLKVRAPRIKADMKNLMTGELARAWMGQTVGELRRIMSGDLGMVLQDGGVPVDGIARSLSSDQWVKVAREFLLTQSE